MADLTGDFDAGPPLLETKLFKPEWRDRLVSRPRLVKQIEQGIDRKLTLVSAPAGFGKSTVLAEWLASSSAASSTTAWVSLDEGDGDPARFWAYAITAMQRVEPTVGTRALATLRAPQGAPQEIAFETVVGSLINEIAESPEIDASADRKLILVLDDYHLVDSDQVHESVGFLIDHLPPQMHVVVTGRAEPPLQIARLRARNELTELRADDLRFSANEAKSFLSVTPGIQLDAGDAESLEQLTEGWIAGLQLAALSLKDRKDVSEFLRTFTGDDRYIVDYLVEEVLKRQPDPVRDFLLETSVFDRFNGVLCDAVTDADSGQQMLERLERDNLFLVPLDGQRNWYRYHHLFSDVLQSRLELEKPGQARKLHQRASAWFEKHGAIVDAIEQAQLANDHESVARLVVAEFDEFDRVGRHTSLSRWLRSLPESMIAERPRLAVMVAFASLVTDHNNRAAREYSAHAEAAITQIETGGDSTFDDINGTVIGPDGLEALKGELLALKLFHSGRNLSIEELTATGKQALDLLPRSRRRVRGMLNMMRAGLKLETGDLADSLPELQQIITEARQDDNPMLLSTALTFRGNVLVALGQLDEARRSYEESLSVSLEFAGESGDTSSMPGVHLSELLLERNEIDSAVKHAEKSLEVANAGPTRSPVLFARATAAIVFAEGGDRDRALEQLESARDFVHGSSDSRFESFFASLELRVFQLIGDLESASNVVRRRGLTPETEVVQENDLEISAFAEYLIAVGDYRGAVRLLTKLLSIVRGRGHLQYEINTLTLLAMAHERAGQRNLALNSLGRATALGEPGRFARTFTGRGRVAKELIGLLVMSFSRSRTPREVGSVSYLHSLLKDIDRAESGAMKSPASASLPEQLTARETEVLRLVAAGMRNQEIADALFISLATVKRHIANAYGKLGVTHRTEAVARAGELRLL